MTPGQGTFQHRFCLFFQCAPLARRQRPLRSQDEFRIELNQALGRVDDEATGGDIHDGNNGFDKWEKKGRLLPSRQADAEQVVTTWSHRSEGQQIGLGPGWLRSRQLLQSTRVVSSSRAGC